MFGPQFGFLQGSGGTFIAIGVTGVVQSYAPPPSALSFLISADGNNAVGVRFAIGSVANSTIGFFLDPGRSVDGVFCGATISICGATTTPGSVQLVNLQWITGS
jgi:hypothetical protein